MQWSEGLPDAVEAPQPRVSAVEAAPGSFPVRSASGALALPSGDLVQLLASHFGDTLLLVATRVPSLGTLLLVRYDRSSFVSLLNPVLTRPPSAADADAGRGPPPLPPAAWSDEEETERGPRSRPARLVRPLLGAHEALHEVAARRLASLLEEAGWTGLLLLSLGLPSAEAGTLRELLPALAALARQVLR